MEVSKADCTICVYCEMNEEPDAPCGIYCGLGESNEDGNCGLFYDYEEFKEQLLEYIEALKGGAIPWQSK